MTIITQEILKKGKEEGKNFLSGDLQKPVS